MTTNTESETIHEGADLNLDEARGALRKLTEVKNLVDALTVLRGLPESARKNVDDLNALTDMLSKDLDLRLRKLHAEVLTVNDNREVVVADGDEQKAD